MQWLVVFCSLLPHSLHYVYPKFVKILLGATPTLCVYSCNVSLIRSLIR